MSQPNRKPRSSQSRFDSAVDFMAKTALQVFGSSAKLFYEESFSGERLKIDAIEATAEIDVREAGRANKRVVGKGWMITRLERDRIAKWLSTLKGVPVDAPRPGDQIIKVVENTEELYIISEKNTYDEIGPAPAMIQINTFLNGIEKDGST